MIHKQVELVMIGTVKAEVPNDLLASIFSRNSSLPVLSTDPDPPGECGGSEVSPTISKEQALDHLVKLNSH